jgi:hypothetical protein
MYISSAAKQRATRQLAFVALLALLATLLSACSTLLPAEPPLPDLHLPGVTQIPGVSSLHHGAGPGLIWKVATAQAGSSSSAPLALFSLDGDLYRIGFDGSDPALIESACDDGGGARPASVTADGHWSLCDLDKLTMIPLPAAGAGATEHDLHLLASVGKEVMGFTNSVTLSPDGRYLALLTDEDEFGECGVAFYEMSSAHDNATLIGVLAFPTDSSFDGCLLVSPIWSPVGSDSSWFAFSRFRSGGAVAFPLQPYLRSLESAPQRPARVTLDPSSLVGLVDRGTNALDPSWTLGFDGLRLNYIAGQYQKTIEQVSLATRQTRTLVTLPDRGRIDALAATPDQRGLIFAHGRTPLCTECQAGETPSHLYIYTPADA